MKWTPEDKASVEWEGEVWYEYGQLVSKLYSVPFEEKFSVLFPSTEVSYPSVPQDIFGRTLSSITSIKVFEPKVESVSEDSFGVTVRTIESIALFRPIVNLDSEDSFQVSFRDMTSLSITTIKISAVATDSLGVQLRTIDSVSIY